MTWTSRAYMRRTLIRLCAVAVCAAYTAQVIAAADAARDHVAEFARLESRAFAHFREYDFEQAAEVQGRLVAVMEQVYASTDWRLSNPRLRKKTFERICQLETAAQSSIAESIVLFVLAQRHVTTGALAKADPLIQTAMSKWEEVLGPDDLFFVDMLDAAAFCTNKLGNHARAASLVAQQLQTLEAIVGKKHPYYATALNSQGLVLLALRQFDDAEKSLQQSKALRRELLGKQSTDYIASVQNLSVLNLTSGNLASAEEFAEEAVSIASNHLPEKHHVLIVSRWQLAKVYFIQKKELESISLFEKLIPLFKDRTCPISGELASEIVESYASTLKAVGRSEDANKYTEWANSLKVEGCGVSLPSD